MKSKFMLLNDDEVHDQLKVYFVMVGNSRREQRQADRIFSAAAGNKDVFWKKWSCDVCDFFRKLAGQVYWYMSPNDAVQKFNECNVRHISLSEAVSLVSLC